jgi:hypothetical protein
MGAHNIWRYNIWAQSYLASVWLFCYNDYGEVTKHNHLYNNTFWKGGYGNYQDYYDPAATAPSASWAKSFHHPINIENDAAVAGNSFKNNLFYQNNTNGTYALGSYYDFVTSELDSYNATGPNRQNIGSNWTDGFADPKFTSVSATANPVIDPATQWNFSLQTTSPAIDSGTYITTARDAGTNSVTLVLDTGTNDAYPSSAFFFDSGAIATTWPSANVDNDWLAIGTTTNTAQISSIDYTTNTITLATAKTWADGAAVWLYKKSDGARVLWGRGPEYGARERVLNRVEINIER